MEFLQYQIVDSIEVNPSAPYIPANIRLKSRLKTKQHHCVYEEKNVNIEPKNKEETEMSNEVYQELTTSFRQLRWLPVPSLFRPLCHLLALQSLQQTSPNVHDQMKAAFYLTNSVFIAFRVNYENELIKKLKNKLNNCASLSTALTTFQDCYRDVPSWNDAIRRTLPSNWLIIQFTLINELNISISGDNPVFLLATKLRSTDAPQTRIIKGFSMKGIDDFENLLVENLQSTSLTKANVYWNKRYNLDHDMEKLLLTTKEQWFSQDDLNWLMSDQTESDPIVLILDRNLSNYPFEWLLSNSSQLHITRMPCLSIALSHLYVTSLITVNNNDQPSTVDTENNRKLIIQDGFYVLNPERNLPSTEQRLMPLLSNPSLNWKGVIGRPPTKDEAIRAMEEHQILMYCGHGSGSRYLFPKILAITRSKAMALLFGCSSSRLLQEGKFEPTSSMLTHLIAGSPCILGLLWDVTDGDIDRYSCRLLESWQSSDNGSKFLHVVRESRMACKLRHLIGKSPVVYGYPLEKR